MGTTALMDPGLYPGLLDVGLGTAGFVGGLLVEVSRKQGPGLQPSVHCQHAVVLETVGVQLLASLGGLLVEEGSEWIDCPCSSLMYTLCAA